jgi:hypothetical protein
MKDPPQRRFKSLSQLLQVHCQPDFGNPDMLFDPCVAAASLPIHSTDLEGITIMIVLGHIRAGNGGGSS